MSSDREELQEFLRADFEKEYEEVRALLTGPEVSELISLAIDQGHLTYDELNDLLPNNLTTDRIDDVMALLAERGITVLERHPESSGEEDVLQHKEEPGQQIASTDVLSSYLRSVRNLSTLSRDEEMTLAQEVQKGRRQELAACLKMPVAAEVFLKHASKVLRGEMAISEVTRLECEDTDQALREAVLEVKKHLRTYKRACEELQDQRPSPGVGARARQARLASARTLGGLAVADPLREAMISRVRDLANQMGKARTSIEGWARKAELPQAELGTALKRWRKDASLPVGRLKGAKVGEAWKAYERSTSRIKQLEEKAAASCEQLLATRRAMAVAARRAHRAQDTLVERNQRLVIHVAKAHLGRGVPLMDLVQEGNIGLIRAIQGFDPNRGFRLSTYAVWWVRQSVARAVASSSTTVRLPVHLRESHRKLESVIRKLLQELGREPTDEELAAVADLPVDKVRSVRLAMRSTLSLDGPVGEDDAVLMDFVSDPTSPVPDNQSAQASLTGEIANLLEGLNERERDVIYRRFGFAEHDEQTLEEVGRHLKVTRERARQIQARALKTLLKGAKRRRLSDFLE